MNTNTVADNLNAVADKIDKGKMWCKGQWASLFAMAENPIGNAERVGCAEGLLAEQVGLHDGYSEVWSYSGTGRFHTVLGLLPNFLGGDDEEVGHNCYYISELRETDEWKTLLKTIKESGVLEELKMDAMPDQHTVTGWNDHEDVSEEDAAGMFRKAAIRADEVA